jgi:hypothetical protein
VGRAVCFSIFGPVPDRLASAISGTLAGPRYYGEFAGVDAGQLVRNRRIEASYSTPKTITFDTNCLDHYLVIPAS